MIEQNEKQTLLHFGRGDIGVGGGHVAHGERKIGIVAFRNEEPKEIGCWEDLPPGVEVSSEEFQVVMAFERKESVDVVIEQLEVAKAQIVEKEEKNGSNY